MKALNKLKLIELAETMALEKSAADRKFIAGEAKIIVHVSELQSHRNLENFIFDMDVE